MKRLIAFLALIAIGITALNLAIGDDKAVRANSGNSEQQKKKRPKRPSDVPVVRMQQGSQGTSVSQSGPLKFSDWREVELGGGRVRKEEVFILKAKDSQPIGEGLQQLIGVTMELFDKGKFAATITASDAFIELGHDDNGNPTFKEQKQVELRDAVVTTEPGSQMAGVRLELGDATITIGDDEVQLTTEADQPVTMSIEGEHSAKLTGMGAIARLPRNKGSSVRKASITIQADPVLQTKGFTVKSDGRMHYVEDTVTGAAKVSLDDNVELDLRHNGLGSPDRRAKQDAQTASNQSTITGDQFTGWLQRHKDSGKGFERRHPNSAARDSMAWHRLVLVGEPAEINTPGVRVTTHRITVRTSGLGDPYIVTAHGGESRIEQTDFLPSKSQSDPLTGIAERRLHLVRPLNSVGAMHRSMGFPQWTLSPLEQQPVVIFEGASRLESGGRSLKASDGFLVARNLSNEAGIIQGFGAVEALQHNSRSSVDEEAKPELLVTGSNGMLLTIAKQQQQLQLGPALGEKSVAWREHRYSVEYGPSTVHGLGGCQITRRGERRTLALLAPHDQIEANFPGKGVALRRVRQLRATLEGNVVTNLDVGGLPAEATLLKNGEQLYARAPRIRQMGQRSLRLLPMELDESPWSELSEIDRTPRLVRTWSQTDKQGFSRERSIEVTGPRIDIHHAGGSYALVDAHKDGEDLPRIYAKLPQVGAKEPATVMCAANRLRVLPFMLTPEVRRIHSGGASGLVTDILLHSLANPWLIVDHVRDFQLDDVDQGHISGTGDRLFMSQGASAVLFVGDPDSLTPATVQRTQGGRTIVMQGARVRVTKGDDVRLSAIGAFDDRSTFLAPTVTLRDPDVSGPLSHVRAVCRGNIHVNSGVVQFDGPVEAQGLASDGSDEPGGLQIDARQLIMKRHAETGEIAQINGKDISLKWARLDAKAAELEFDVQRGHCIAIDPSGAQVQLPDGRQLRSVRIFVNYRTGSFRTGPSRALQPSNRKQVSSGRS